MFVNFEQLEECRDDRFGFVGVIGCNMSQRSESLIEISEQPLTIIGGVSYFLLSSEWCGAEVLKLIYALCQSIYVPERLLTEFESNISGCVDITETWDIHNHLYVVAKALNDSESQLRTAAETRETH
jgi:hypothetical protein